MSNYGINQKTIDFFKNNGKNIVCSTLAAVALMVPCKAKLESSNQEVTNTTKIEEMDEMQDMVFVVTTEWKKTDNYSDGKGPVKENREYQRKIRRYIITENFNEEYFKDNYQKVLETIRNGKGIENILEMVDEKEETILVDGSEEKKLDQKYWHLEVEGTNIKATALNPDTDFDIKNTLAMFGVIGLLFGAVFLGAGIGAGSYYLAKKMAIRRR